MANRNKNDIASKVRNTLISQHGYQADGDYVRKPISDNYGIGFYHDDESTLCICIYHREGTDFSPSQRKMISDILSRDEFTASYHELVDGTSADGKNEIWAPLKIDAFGGYDGEGIADWIVKLFNHFFTTAELLGVK